MPALARKDVHDLCTRKTDTEEWDRVSGCWSGSGCQVLETGLGGEWRKRRQKGWGQREGAGGLGPEECRGGQSPDTWSQAGRGGEEATPSHSATGTGAVPAWVRALGRQGPVGSWGSRDLACVLCPSKRSEGAPVGSLGWGPGLGTSGGSAEPVPGGVEG